MLKNRRYKSMLLEIRIMVTSEEVGGMASKREDKGEFWGASNVLFLDLCLDIRVYSFYTQVIH